MDIINALQYGGVSASVTAIMFLAYKALQMCINHRVRSECGCCDWSLGLIVTDVIPTPRKADEKTKPLLKNIIIPPDKEENVALSN